MWNAAGMSKMRAERLSGWIWPRGGRCDPRESSGGGGVGSSCAPSFDFRTYNLPKE